MKIKSQAQAGYFGAVASGNAKSRLKPAKAVKMLRENRGMKMAALPERAPSRTPSRRVRRVSRRGGR